MSKRILKQVQADGLGPNPPLYKQVQEDLLKQIVSGTLGPGDRLPSERDLCTYYDVSRITVRRAVSELVGEGALYAVQGKGVFISDQTAGSVSGGTIRVALSGRDASVLGLCRRVLEMFTAQDPRFQVELVSPAVSLRQRITGGGAADMFVIREYELPGLMADDVLMDITELVQRDLDLDLEHPRGFYREAFPFGCRNSRFYAFPETFSPCIMAYNREHFRAAGLEYPYPEDWDWNTFREYAQRLTVRGAGSGPIERYGFFMARDPARWTNFLLQTNGGIFDTNDNFILDSGRSQEALGFCRQLLVDDRVASIGAPAQQAWPFINGMASMSLESYYSIRAFRDIKFEWGVGKLPRGRTKANLFVGSYLGIHRDCPNPERAWELIKFFTSYPVQRLYLEERHGAPVRREVVEETDAAAWPLEHRYIFWEEMEVSRPILWGSDATEMRTLVSEGLEMVWLGLETVEEACAGIRKRLGLEEGIGF